jgi:hypothetical protein
MANLDYLFKTRDNYVMQDELFPPGEITMKPEDPTKGKPFAGLAKNPRGKTVAPAPIISEELPTAPVSPTLPKLKEIFSTQPVVEQPQQPTYTPPVATSDLVDMEKIRGQVDGMMPERGMSDWLSVLAPLATEAIFGGGKAGGVSYGIAGKAATDIVGKDEAKRSKLEDKLMDIERARAIAGAKAGKSGTFSPIKMQDPETGHSIIAAQSRIDGSVSLPDGTKVPGNYIRAAGVSGSAEFDRKIEKGAGIRKEEGDYFGKNTRVNPQTGELEIIRNGASTPVITGQPKQEFNKKQQGDVAEMVTDFTKSPAYAESVNSLSIAPTVTSLLDAAQRTNNPNSVAGKSVMLTMIRQAQKTGPVSDKDAASMGGTEQLAESLDRLEQKLMGQGGSITIRDIQELREISEIYRKRSQSLLADHYSQSSEAYKKRFGLSDEQIKGQLDSKVKPYLDSSNKSFKSSSLPEGVDFNGSRQYPPKKNPNATVPYSVDGKLFWAEPGNDDSIMKENPNAKRLK